MLFAARLFSIILFAATVASASDLGDGMQLYFSGDFQNSHAVLTKLVSQGDVDPRTHFFRGLTNRRLGDNKAAAMDFGKGAALELTGDAKGVGESLQRVQGMDRLVLEKHRTMARLAARHRAQPTAPAPIVIAATREVKLVTAPPTKTDVPVFRLASEIPFRQPSAAVAEGIPATGPIPPAPNRSTAMDEQPVGTGVATAETNADFDPFADVDVDDEASASTDAKPQQSDGSVLGAVFRAFGNAVVGGSADEAPAAAEADETDEVDPFGDDSFDMGDEDEDPFGDF